MTDVPHRDFQCYDCGDGCLDEVPAFNPRQKEWHHVPTLEIGGEFSSEQCDDCGCSAYEIIERHGVKRVKCKTDDYMKEYEEKYGHEPCDCQAEYPICQVQSHYVVF